VSFLVGYITPQDYGAKGDGTTDDTAAIQAAINAIPVDGVLFMPPAVYRTSSPLTVPPGVNILGHEQRRPRNSFMSYANLTDQATIKPLASFTAGTGSAVIYIPDAKSTSWSTMAQGTSILGIKLDCTALPNGGGIDGVRVYGQVQGLILDNVSVMGPSGYCFNFLNNASVTSGPINPFSLRVRGCFATGGGTATTQGGFNIYNCTDSLFLDCETIAVGGDGWTIQGGGNTVFQNCRSENNGSGNGFTVTQTGGGTKAIATMIGCSTNANSGHGFNITNAQHVTLTGCFSTGDGSSSAGFNISSSTGIVAVNDCTSVSGSTSKYGLQIGSTLNATVHGGSFYGVTSGFNDAGSNTNVFLSPNVLGLTGSTSTPTVTVQSVQIGENAVTGPLDVSTGQALGVAIPRAHANAIAWSFDPVSASTGQAGTAGTLYLASVYVNRTVTATKLSWGINTAGSGATAGQNFVGLYSSAGTQLASVGVDARVTTTGAFSETISAALTPGQYWVAFLFNASAMPQIYRAGFLNGGLVNFNLSASTYRFATNGTSLTALPGSITPSSNSAAMYTYWAALG
jgi:hypothetical protein